MAVLIFPGALRIRHFPEILYQQPIQKSCFNRPPDGYGNTPGFPAVYQYLKYVLILIHINQIYHFRTFKSFKSSRNSFCIRRIKELF